MDEPNRKSLILIGYRASGKTTVGRILAERLGWAFIDVDECIEAAFGESIADIFSREGETGFRNRESSALKALSGRNCSVIATGGGAVLRLENRNLLRSLGFVAWLISAPQTILSRIENDPTTAARRPKLTASGGLDEVRELLKVREPLYRETADFVINSDEISPEGVATAILTAWPGQHTYPSPSGAAGFSSSDSSSGRS
jgi:shikimate kinase